jgi:RHS repeat-associated protein
MTRILRLTVPLLLSLILLIPAAVDVSVIEADPPASLADPAYPLNHTFDADVLAVGAPPANSDFETASYTVGTPPANHNLESAAQDAGTPPTNHDFEAGSFSGWTTSGTTSIQSDTPHGYYAKLQASGTIISSAFTVDSTAQSLAFDVGYLSTSGYSWVKVYALTGPTYSTETLLKDVYCNNCGYWSRYAINASSYLGQSIKLKFYRYGGDVGIDDVSAQIVFPDFTQTGSPQRRTEAGPNTYAFIDGATLTSAAFTVDANAQFATIRVQGQDSLNRSQYKVWVLSGAGFATSTQVALGYANYGWQTVRFNVSSWQGQQIKIKAEEIAYDVAFDDFGIQSVDIPSWVVTGNTSVLNGGPTGKYVRTDGQLTSSAFTLDANVQQLSLAYKGEGALSQFYLELLRGPDFSQVVDLNGGVILADPNEWKTFKAGVSTYAGETVKLRLRKWFGWVLFDNAGPQEQAVPGWKLNTNDAVSTGSDSNGTYVTPFKTNGTFYLKSADISPGIIDRAGTPDQKYFAISYEIGYATGSLVRVKWYNSTGSNWVVFLDAADTPTGFRTKYFYLADFQGTEGYFEVQVTGGGKVYSIADNIARQHLREPFSQKVGYRIDTSTGSFGYDDRDIALEGRMPLSFTRSYNGHSDRFGALGYRWTHTYDTRLELSGNDAGVVFGSGGEEFFIWSTVSQTFSPGDSRVHNQLIKNGDQTYTYKTKDNLSYNFTSAGRLTNIKDLDNNTISLAYDGSSRLTSVTDPDSRSLALTYDGNGKLATLTDPIRVASGAAESGTQCGTNGTGNGTDDDADNKVDDGCPTLKYTYDANGDLTSVIDGNNGIRTYSYNKHRLISAVDARGKTIFTNTLNSVNRVVTQTDPLNFTININYDTPAKGVTSAVDPLNNTAKYYYDIYHRTTDKVDPLGRTESYVYDSVGNLQKIIDPYLKQWQFGYNTDADITSATDPLGIPVSIAYNPQHLPTSITDARGYITTMTYDANGNMTSLTDATRQPNGPAESGAQCGTNGTGNSLDDDADTKIDDGCPSTKYVYDTAGKVTTMTNALGFVESYTYDANGNMATKTDARGKLWTYTHDAAGRKTSETTPLGHTTTYIYDLFGRPLAVKNHLNQQTIYLYDLAGHLLRVEDPLGNQTNWAYDDRGLAISKTDPVGKVTTYAYEGTRNLISATDPTRQPNGAAESGTQCGTAGTGNNVDEDSDTKFDDGCPSKKYAYDANNRLLTETDGEGGVVTWTYDNAGRVSTEKDPLNRTTSYTYDDAGRLLTTTLPNTGIITYAYDANGNLLTDKDPLNRTTTYAFDPLNRRTTMTNPLNKATTQKYDAVGQIVEVLDPLLNSTKYSYNPTGQLVTITDPLNHARTFGYDDAGRRTSATDALNRTTTYGYDAASRLNSVTAPGNFTTSYAYDAAGRLSSTTRPAGGITSSTYDARDLVTSSTDPLRQPNGAAESGTQCGSAGTGNNADEDADTKVDDGCPSAKYGYDDAGRPTSMTDALGRTTTYAFDDSQRMTSMTDALGGVVSFGYDLAGQQTSLTNPRGKTTTYTYNSLGGELTRTDPLNRTHTNTYNLAGELTRTTDARGVIVDYAYDLVGRLTTQTIPGGTVGFGYDNADRQTSMTDPTGTTSWAFDAASRVTSVTSPQGVVSYTYNDADQRATMTLPGSRTITYGYDTAGRLGSLTDWQSRTTNLTYDSNSNRIGVNRPNAVNSTYAYDLADRVTSITHTGPGGTLKSFSYMYDAVGNRKSVTTAAGTESYVFDALNRITSATYTNGDLVEYTYDANGNRLTKKLNSVTQNTYTYDNDDQLTYDGSTSYTHDNNGNMTAAGTNTYTWDYANRMTGATVGGTSSTYIYAGDDVRASKTVGGSTTSYLWDRESGLPLLVGDGTNWYLHADNLIAEVDNANAAKYHLNDALGSVRGIADGAGALAGSADYDVFGAVRASSGSSSKFGFTGEQFDSETAFTHLRARYLNPSLGRFGSADSVQPNAPGTQGFNLYAYVANNPTTWVDPSGHQVDFGMAARTLAEVPFIRPMIAGLTACGLHIAGCAGWIARAFTYIASGRLQPIGMAVGTLGIIAMICYLSPICRDAALTLMKLGDQLGSDAANGIDWTLDKLEKLEIKTYCWGMFVQCELGKWVSPKDKINKASCADCARYCVAQGGVWPKWKCPIGDFTEALSVIQVPWPNDSVANPFTLAVTGCSYTALSEPY